MAAPDRVESELRRSFETAMPTEAPLALDAERWREVTMPHASKLLSSVRRKKRVAFAVLSTVAAAAIFALPALTAKPKAPTQAPVPKWSGKGPLINFKMVSPTVGWAMPQIGPPSVVLHTTTGPRGFKAVSTYPVAPGASYGVTWHVFNGMDSIMVINDLVPHTLVVERTTDGGVHWSDTRIVLPKRDGRWLLGNLSWWNAKDGIMAVYLVKKGRRSVSLGSRVVAHYGTTTGGREWSPLPFDTNKAGPPDLGILALTGSRTVIAGTTTTLWRSTNGGRTFSKVTLPAPLGGGPLTLLGGGSVAFPGGGPTGVLLAKTGTSAVAYVTTDGGATWNVSQEFPGAPEPFLATAAGSWWVTSSNWATKAGTGEIWTTSDAGAHWSSIGIPAPFAALMKKKYLLQQDYFVSAEVGYALWETNYTQEKILMTSDGGKTWSVVWSYNPLGAPGG